LNSLESEPRNKTFHTKSECVSPLRFADMQSIVIQLNIDPVIFFFLVNKRHQETVYFCGKNNKFLEVVIVAVVRFLYGLYQQLTLFDYLIQRIKQSGFHLALIVFLFSGKLWKVGIWNDLATKHFKNELICFRFAEQL